MKDEMTGDFGELEIKFGILGGRGANITREFLRRLLHQIITKSTKYYDEARHAGDQDHVFTYREKQFHSVVCPAIADITSYFLIENPLHRKPAGEAEYSGSVDYWIYYKNYSFMMELKHTYFAYTRADNPRGTVTERFSEALKQLGDIRKDECRGLTYGNGLRKIALEAVVFYRGSKEENKLKVDIKSEDFRVLLRKLLRNTELGKRSNLHALWLLNKRLVTPFEYANTFEIYPAVAFVGHVSDIVK
jgi:hypothetical protein